MHTTVDEMEGVAQGILKERSGRIASIKKRRPVPVPPRAPAVAAQETDQPEVPMRRKKRPIPMIPSIPVQNRQEATEANSKV